MLDELLCYSTGTHSIDEWITNTKNILSTKESVENRTILETKLSLYLLVVSFVKYRGVYVVALYFIVPNICTFSLVTFSVVGDMRSCTI